MSCSDVSVLWNVQAVTNITSLKLKQNLFSNAVTLNINSVHLHLQHRPLVVSKTLVTALFIGPLVRLSSARVLDLAIFRCIQATHVSETMLSQFPHPWQSKGFNTGAFTSGMATDIQTAVLQPVQRALLKHWFLCLRFWQEWHQYRYDDRTNFTKTGMPIVRWQKSTV